MNDLKKWMEDSCIKYTELAENLGINSTHAHKLMNGNKQPSLPLALKIEEISKGEVKVQSWKRDSD